MLEQRIESWISVCHRAFRFPESNQHSSRFKSAAFTTTDPYKPWLYCLIGPQNFFQVLFLQRDLPDYFVDLGNDGPEERDRNHEKKDAEYLQAAGRGLFIFFPQLTGNNRSRLPALPRWWRKCRLRRHKTLSKSFPFLTAEEQQTGLNKQLCGLGSYRIRPS